MPSATQAPAEGPAGIAVGNSPLLAAASTLLTLLARLRNTARAPDADDLRTRAVAELRRFEQLAREAGIEREPLRAAHYALCASLDDVVLATPWGAEGDWGVHSLVSTFHQQVRSGEGFFSVLRQMTQSPAVNLQVIELMYFCLSLGFQGQYRLSPRGPAELDRVREDLYGLITRHRVPVEAGLSPHWPGVDAPYRPRRTELPLWVAAVAGLTLVGSVFAFVLIRVEVGSDAVVTQFDAAAPYTMPGITRPITADAPVVALPPAVEPDVCGRLRNSLAADIANGVVVLACTAATPLLRVSGDGMFASGSARVEPGFLPPLARIGAALKDEPGPVTVAGYTDSQPIRTLRFPSNTELSQARAEAALAQMATAIGNPARLTPEGRGDADPIAPAEHRERNRRIEIILRQGD